ncbi:hypothetical protein RhiirA1_403623, partial [Rhizophagus irregularis]
RKRKRASESSSKSVATGITTVGEYIGGGSFGKVFSGHYNNQVVAWKTCDAYKQQEEMKTLNHEARIYSILKECQGRDVPRLFYKGYIYDRYLFALALQLIEDSRHIDPARLTKKEKELIVNQLRSIHNLGVLHNDISPRNILYEPKSRRYFFIDFGLRNGNRWSVRSITGRMMRYRVINYNDVRYGMIGFGFSFWVLDRYWLCWIG